MKSGRHVSLVLLDEAGALVGALPAYDVGLPYWQEVSDVAAEVRATYGIEVDVLRLLSAQQPAPHGGAVTYLAQLRETAPRLPDSLEPIGSDMRALIKADEPLRQPYARPGGPAATLAWASHQLREPYAAEQQRTWNLSAIWRLDAPDDSRVWVKQVPSFFAHEAAILAWAQRAVPGTTPRLLAAGTAGRMLLGHVDGEDLYDSGPEDRLRIVETAHRIQRASTGAVAELLDVGVPDRRGSALARWICSQLGPYVLGHPFEPALNNLLDDLERRIDDADACGLPACLVHGDEHSGNAIGTDERVVILDWGDAFVGHPAFDAMRLEIGLAAADAGQVTSHWANLWRRAVPGCEPERAVELLRPVEALRAAAVYAHFTSSIEPSERPYHRADVDDWLLRAVEPSP